ncbi:EAL domain-containing protein [Thiomicrorhabdus indica]|uniref:bifunctional diguanylate cyclase/phosphodiesterase n=1 Tax=Thiomicrorhabdus indica TaxID=2267253 RepID=UPI002AA5E7E5|nr:EAL domain-containing protein [Thiomicrorhabdus indica]
MSFKSKILLFLSLMLMVLLVGTFSLNMSNTQAFLEKQLQSHANDTATSLGLSLSSVANLEEPSSIHAMIDAVFDRGHFERIELIDMEGNSIYQRTNNEFNANIPHWFVNAIELNIPTASAVVQSGWMPIGNLEVKGHEGYAYIELWVSFKEILQYFAIAAVVFLIGAYLAIKVLLRPLQKVEQQAKAIVRKEYILQEEIPDTTEFKNLVIGMNDMVSKLEKVFEREAQVAEKLRLMAYQDSVTGLHNRHYFDMIFNRLVDENERTAEGSMCLLKLNGLKELNDRYGYQLGNHFIKHIAMNFSEQLDSQDSIFVRLNGIELLAVIPNQKPNSIRDKAFGLIELPRQAATALNVEELPVGISVAMIEFSPKQSRAELFTRMDVLIKQADEDHHRPVRIQSDQKQTAESDANWETRLDKAIANDRFHLFKQSSFDHKQKIHDSELLIRMQDEQGNMKSAAFFMPAVEQLNRQIDIDQLVLRLVIASQIDRPVDITYSINLSRVILDDPKLFDSLKPILQQAKGFNLAFEFPENAVQSHLKASEVIFNELKQLGFKVGIDRVGMHASNMHFLKTLRPNYIKLDGAFSERIESDVQTQSYVASICEMATSLDIEVLAMSIENAEQMEAFRKSGIKFFQGYFFGTPMPI